MTVEDNVLITYMKIFYENCMASLVAMATIHEKKSNDISYGTTEPFYEISYLAFI